MQQQQQTMRKPVLTTYLQVNDAFTHTSIYIDTVETLSLALLPSPLPWTFPRLQEVKKRLSRDISSLKNKFCLMKTQRSELHKRGQLS